MKWVRKLIGIKDKENPISMIVANLAISIKVLDKDDGNIATGEIKKFNFCRTCNNKFSFGDRITTSTDGYSGIWVYIADNWFKQIGKYDEGPWSCQ